MNLTAVRWYPVLLMRNALGRFMSLRVPRVPVRRTRRPRATTRIQAVQLALF